jgi:Flp pilus assembly protein TadD
LTLNLDDAGSTDLLYGRTRDGQENPSSAHHTPRALAGLKEAAALKPSEPQPHQQMALIYSQTGHPEQARAEQQKLNRLTQSSNN